MPKFNVEIDTDNRTFIVKKDGQETLFTGFAALCYQSYMEQDEYCYQISWTTEDDKGKSVTHTADFRKETDEMTNINMAEKLGQHTEDVLSAEKLAKALYKKK